MPALRGITVSVGYGPLLRITLPRNMRHATEWLIVTSPEDAETQDVAKSVPGVRLHVTDAMRRHQARFNKGLCFEECWDTFGRDGWWMIVDADILLPPALPLDRLDPTMIHGARRRILEDPGKWRDDLIWTTCPIHVDGGPIGFAQIFHADAPALAGKRPWYDVSFAHAGGGDAAFMDLFSPAHRRMLPIDVLHLGPPDVNWWGTDQEGRDMMARYIYENNWHRAKKRHTPESAARSPELVDRVQVPGYEPSTYELPFTRRARQLRGQK